MSCIILVALLTVIAVLSSIFCFFNGYKEIPLGFALGGFVVSLLYVVGHFLYQLDVKNGEVKYSILMIGFRNIIMISTIIVFALMYYRWEIKLFNIFAYIGIYTAGIIIFVIDHLVYKNK